MILHADALEGLASLPSASAHCAVTSPPYWGLRDYGTSGQLGLEKTPEEYCARLVGILREVRRVLRSDGSLWLNLGDSYAASSLSNHERGKATPAFNGRGEAQAGARTTENPPRRAPSGDLKPKDLIGIPWLVAFALRADGWWLRSEVIWHKPNPMPESVKDRPTRAHETLFLLTKSARYYYDAAAIAEPMTETMARRPNLLQFREDRPDIGSTARSNGRRGSVRKNEQQPDRRRAGFNDRWDATEDSGAVGKMRNRRSVWKVSPRPFPGAHFATFPPKLIEPCILAGCPPGGIVLDPFGGAGTTRLVAHALGRRAILIDNSMPYCLMAKRRAT